jgi:hypothetical protein
MADAGRVGGAVQRKLGEGLVANDPFDPPVWRRTFPARAGPVAWALLSRAGLNIVQSRTGNSIAMAQKNRYQPGRNFSLIG